MSPSKAFASLVALRRRDATVSGVPVSRLVAGVAEGRWERLARGLYVPVDRPPIPWLTLHEVQRYAPRAIFCLETALQFHGLSDVHPHAVWLSLPRGSRPPAIRWVAIELVTVAPSLWELGADVHDVDGGSLRITSVARTVVDAFRFRRRVGLDVALQALREARARKLVTPAEVIAMARPFHQERVVLPYLQAIG